MSPCGHKASIIDSRPGKDYRRRRYECAHCGRYWTVEVRVDGHGSKDLGPAMASIQANTLRLAVVKDRLQEMIDMLGGTK